jgi:HEPN domain-containing protein
VPYEIICFHCQQAGEKALKAILAYFDDEIPRTHNLMVILNLCEIHYTGITNKFVNQADRLSAFAVVTRYPNETEVQEGDMVIALKDAEQIFLYVKTLW